MNFWVEHEKIPGENFAQIGIFFVRLQGNVKKIVDDVAALRPTLFIAVPRVLERIQSGIAGKIGGQGAIAKLVFGLAYKIKQMRLWMGSSVEGVSPLRMPLLLAACHTLGRLNL